MKYMLIFTEPEAEAAKRNHPDHAAAYWGGWTTYIEAMYKAGVVVSGEGLQLPMTATTVRVRDGKRIVQDGPFADTKEQLGGYFIIDVPDLDAAIDWAAQAPSALVAAVEVRPVLPPPQA
ncbi:MAG: YciI family protein [Paracoccaceae bacterium]